MSTSTFLEDQRSALSDTIAVQASDLRCSYGSYEAVHGIDLSIGNGEFFALLGTNGAGKTTTMETLEGHRAPSSGTLSVLGGDPSRNRSVLRPRMGIMLQEAGFADDLTVAETIRLWLKLSTGVRAARENRTETIRSSMDALELSDKADTRVRQLSGGQRRRLDLVLATVNEPEILFLDEPTTGLDPESRERTWAVVKAMHDAGTTVVLTTHYLEEAETLADRIAIMHEGNIAVSGSLPEVLGAEPASIRFVLNPAVRVEELTASGMDASFTPTPTETRVRIATDNLQQDLYRVLAWAQAGSIRLERLSASEASLAEVFRRVSAGGSGQANHKENNS